MVRHAFREAARKVLIRSIGRQLRFRLHYRKHRLAHALANVFREGGVSPRALFAMYRLGMYASVAAAGARVSGWEGAFSRAVSFAACGQIERAREALAAFRRCRGAERQRAKLAAALAPFLPDDALNLVEGRSRIPQALHCGLMLRTGRFLEAQQMLTAIPDKVLQTQPELYLHHTNAFGGGPLEQLGRLNAFLQHFGVSAVRLIDDSRPPSPVNVAGTVPNAVLKDGPLVSVLMTTFRTGNRAVAAIESILAQSYRELEIIVVDDAGGDETLELLQAFAHRQQRVRIVPLSRNVGPYAAKLIGLSLARGVFITCHDSDDWSHPEKIARQVAPLLADKRLVGTVSNLLRIQDDGVFYARAVHPIMRLNSSSLLFRREPVLREAGAWDCVRMGADSELLARLRVVFGPSALKKIGLPLSLVSHRPDSLMTSTATGYSEFGISPSRLAYGDAYARWHIEALKHGGQPFVPPSPLAAARTRHFPVPQALQVPIDDVEECVRGLEHAGYAFTGMEQSAL